MLTPVFYRRVHNKRRGLCKQTETLPPSFKLKHSPVELPQRLQLPLSRLSLSEIRREVITQGLVAEISGSTLWRWLGADALRPWRHLSWIFPRDPDFAAKAGRILDL
jgi:hypothetical protein